MSCTGIPYWPFTNTTTNDASKLNAALTGLSCMVAEGTGATGLTGETGPQGLTGPAGGPVGATGPAGTDGVTGLQGTTGLANFSRGSIFPAGPEDLQLYWDNEDEIVYFYNTNSTSWIDISSGAMGVTGPGGVTGLANFSRGDTFPAGPDDLQLYWDNQDEIVYFYNSPSTSWIDISSGTRSVTGVQGATGWQGETGALGNTGAIGVTGLRGPTGWQGVTGVQGNTGVHGVHGDTGVRGLMGYPGGYTGMLSMTWDGQGDALFTGMSGFIRLPLGVQFDNWTILGLPTGSINIKIEQNSYAGWPISNFEMETVSLSAGVKNTGSTSGWNGATGAQGDIISFDITNNDYVTVATLNLAYHQG